MARFLASVEKHQYCWAFDITHFIQQEIKINLNYLIVYQVNVCKCFVLHSIWTENNEKRIVRSQ